MGGERRTRRLRLGHLLASLLDAESRHLARENTRKDGVDGNVFLS